MKEQKKKIFLIMLLVIISIISYVFMIRPKGYGFIGGKVKFEVINNLGYNPTHKINFTVLDKYIIRSSKDGVTMLDINGTTIWDKTFNMTNPKVIKEKDYLAVGDISARDVYLFNKDGFIRSYHVDYPIIMYDINENGIVAIIEQSDKGHIVQLFDTDGKKLIHRETFLDNDGYPLSFDISRDGTKMVTSYLFVKGNTMISNLTFFDFSDTGQNYDERVTGGFGVEGTVIPEIQFLDNEHVSAIGDDKILFYKVDITPERIEEVEIANEIKKIDYIDSKVLILFGRPIKNDDNYKENSLVTYSNIGEASNLTEFNSDITYLIGNGQKYYVQSELFIREYYNGKINWESTLKEDIKNIMSLGNNRYLIVLQNEYKIVELVK